MSLSFTSARRMTPARKDNPEMTNEHDQGHLAAPGGNVPSAASEEATRPVADAAPTEQEPPDEWEEWDDEWACTHCGGEGYREVDDPLWDDCDEFGYGPCDSCSGTGLRKHQTVF